MKWKRVSQIRLRLSRIRKLCFVDTGQSFDYYVIGSCCCCPEASLARCSNSAGLVESRKDLKKSSAAKRHPPPIPIRASALKPTKNGE